MTDQAQTETGLQSASAYEELTAGEGGAASLVNLEEQTMKAMVLVAKRWPRDEAKAREQLTKRCEVPSFAEDANYALPRGNTTIVGPSVYLAREAARFWKNVRSGIRIRSRDKHWVHLLGWAHDCEDNKYTESDLVVELVVFRKKGGWREADENEVREIINRNGAFCERNALLKIFPSDMIDDAAARARLTLHKSAAADLAPNKRGATLTQLIAAFAEIGVTGDMLERKLERLVQDITPEQLAMLRTMYKSIKSGQARRDDLFGDNGRSEPTRVTIDPDSVRPKTDAQAPAADAPAGGTQQQQQQPQSDAQQPADDQSFSQAPPNPDRDKPATQEQMIRLGKLFAQEEWNVEASQASYRLYGASRPRDLKRWQIDQLIAEVTTGELRARVEAVKGSAS